MYEVKEMMNGWGETYYTVVLDGEEVIIFIRDKNVAEYAAKGLNLQNWYEQLDDREIEEIIFSCEYVKEYNHGTDGHLSKTVISKLTNLLE